MIQIRSDQKENRINIKQEIFKMDTVKKLFPKLIEVTVVIIFFIGILVTSSCSDDENVTATDNEPEISEVSIEPESATFAAGEQEEFSAYLISVTGDTVNDEVEVEWSWISSDSDVFTVQDNGTVTAQNAGEAYCIVEAELVSEKGLKVNFSLVPIGLDSAFVTVLN
jgi:hypothetical protein